MKRRAWIWWLLPLTLYSEQALAWGLATHLYFAQLLVWAVPLADSRLRRAVRRLPRLLLAGACLPDLTLVAGRLTGFATSHEWRFAWRLMEKAASDEERALAVGYASHLFVDVLAHNHFVPAHEALWLKVPVLTHAVAEWVMDAHVACQLFAYPQVILDAEAARIVPFVARHFACSSAEAARGVKRLSQASGLLYGSRLHRLLGLGARALDRCLARRCDHYVAEITARLPEINRLLAGEAPNWRADLPCPVRTAHLAGLGYERLRGPLPLPKSLFG
ncbi:zinc dependent phospholipase C family protein [Thiobacter aerophilum]|uniref:Zinc dependent phospholipase C family protein n=1 Tax=Thiobacter aerophilum TaxID=3121275 RepID=A0ABV0EFZ2_9BURK